MEKMKVIIFGAGQTGRTVLTILNTKNYDVIAFVDNNEALHGSSLCKIPVYNTEEIRRITPDLVFIAVLGEERTAEIKKQLNELGINSEKINSIEEIRNQFDMRSATMKLLAVEIENRNIWGAVAELGIYKGDFALQINAAFPDRKLYLFDTFEGFDERDIAIEKECCFSKAEVSDFSDTSLDLVIKRFPTTDNIIFVKGYFPDSSVHIVDNFAFVSIDTDLYCPVYEGLKFFYPLMTRGGVIMIHDYNNSRFRGVSEAVNKFCREEKIFLIPLCDIHGSATIIKM
jgi:O-methyltransferase